jgi:hypothetical protein
MTTSSSNRLSNPLQQSAWVLLAVLLTGILYAGESVQYPDTFRRWVHVGTGLIMPGGPYPESEQGMHQIFANQKAVDGYLSGVFPDGSVLVYELRKIQNKNGVISDGELRRIDVMIKDTHHYSETGGWRFERFIGNDKTQDVTRDSGTACYQCHTNVKDHGFVFSQLR